MLRILCLFLFTAFSGYAQLRDTITYPWPLSPMNRQTEIGGVFGEYRSTDTAGHYHNGTDMGAAAGTPVLAVLPGVVADAYDDGNTGYDSYVRVGTNYNGQMKYLTYYHTRPIVTTGQSVTVGQQISTIAIDHVHLIDYRLGGSISNSHLNALRPDGGVRPYSDPWKPYIRYVRFFADNSNTELSANSLGGKIDIMVHIEEVNGTSSASQNNGAYMVGYKILSADRSAVVYNPPDNGLRYSYYNIPGNAYANVNYYKPESSTSKHVYIVTNGSGANAVATTQTVGNNYWDTGTLPFGNYTVMVFTIDSRGNADTVYVPVKTFNKDFIPPAQPVMKQITKTTQGNFILKWTEPSDSDLVGYRLWYTFDGINYYQREVDSVLRKGTTSKSYSYNLSNALYFRLAAYDTASPANFSAYSDIYGLRLDNSGKRLLLVDGFDRYGGGGSWATPYHDFVIRYGEVIPGAFESVHHSAVLSGAVQLSDYNAVIWILGDESTTDETFSSQEQTIVKNYLEAGGKLFISGSEIAWDLEGAGSGTTQDVSFLRNYLKAKYVADNAGVSSAISSDTVYFKNQVMSFGITSSGSPYPEDYPDVIDTVGGSFPIFRYNIAKIAGISYTGQFGNSVNTGQLIYLAFPFETIAAKSHRQAFMNGVLNYFGMLTTAMNEEQAEDISFMAAPAFPNPFTQETTINYNLPETGEVTCAVYDVLGKEMAVLKQGLKYKGKNNITIPASKLSLSSGVYYYSLTCNGKVVTGKFVYYK